MKLSLLSILMAPLAIVLALHPRATILFSGDAMQHKAQIESARQPDGTYSYSNCFIPVADIISSADYSVVNLETPLGGKPYRGYPCFNAPDSFAFALRDAGFDLMLTANNHTLDAGYKGLSRTISVLDSLGVDHIGTYHNAAHREQSLPLIKDINGFKIGFLNYTYGTNGFTPSRGVVVDYINHSVMADDIKEARDKGAEIICVSVHWGDEYKLLPNQSQKSLANFLCEQGVDIIFGGHPHVIQPMEVIENKATGRKTALIYSLGNFISNMKTRDTRGGAIALVTLHRDSTGRAEVKSLAYRTVFTDSSDFTLYPSEQLPSGRMTANRDAFVESAESVFQRHNRNIDAWPKYPHVQGEISAPDSTEIFSVILRIFTK